MSQNMEQGQDVLEYKNLWKFYENLYVRLFQLINNIIEEKHFNIRQVKDEVIDFTDNYSYYIMGKKIVELDDTTQSRKESKQELLDRLRSFDYFTNNLAQYPSAEFIKIRQKLLKQEMDIGGIPKEDYKKIMTEYYEFFDEVVTTLSSFIEVASTNGFLPNIKSKSSLKNIGYANYDIFFKELENLKMKMSEMTTTLKAKNLLKCRRCMYCVLVVFSPYFKNKQACQYLIEQLDFSFIYDEDKLSYIRSAYDFDTLDEMPRPTREAMLELITPLKQNISLIKRYMSHEFGEVEINPSIRQKYNYDPTWT